MVCTAPVLRDSPSTPATATCEHRQMKCQFLQLGVIVSYADISHSRLRCNLYITSRNLEGMRLVLHIWGCVPDHLGSTPMLISLNASHRGLRFCCSIFLPLDAMQKHMWVKVQAFYNAMSAQNPLNQVERVHRECYSDCHI